MSAADAPAVLVVEDDPTIQAMITRCLKLYGYRVQTALRRDEIFGAVDSKNCAAIVLDLGLPGDDGVEIARALRLRSEIPILMLTGRAGIQQRVAGLEAGADDYIVKPFADEELVARLRAVVRRASRRASPRRIPCASGTR